MIPMLAQVADKVYLRCFAQYAVEMDSTIDSHSISGQDNTRRLPN